MLNIFPIQFLSFFSYFLLRLFVAGILGYLGWLHIRKHTELKQVLRFSWFPYGNFASYVFAYAELILAGMFLIGLYTQIAALLCMIMSLKLIVLRNYFVHPSIPTRIFYVLLLGVSITLFITGAGPFAFDLPI